MKNQSKYWFSSSHTVVLVVQQHISEAI